MGRNRTKKQKKEKKDQVQEYKQKRPVKTVKKIMKGGVARFEGRCGLVGGNNKCYLNSAIQLLLSIDSFNNYLETTSIDAINALEIKSVLTQEEKDIGIIPCNKVDEPLYKNVLKAFKVLHSTIKDTETAAPALLQTSVLQQTAAVTADPRFPGLNAATLQAMRAIMSDAEIKEQIKVQQSTLDKPTTASGNDSLVATNTGPPIDTDTILVDPTIRAPKTKKTTGIFKGSVYEIFIALIEKVESTLIGTTQQNASSFVNEVLSILHCFSNDSDIKKVVDTFSFQFKTTYTCSNNYNKPDKYVYSETIELPNFNSMTDISSLIEKYTTTEDLVSKRSKSSNPEGICGNTRGKVKYTKTESIHVPEENTTLIFTLKRFNNDLRKIKTMVKNTPIIDVDNKTYILYGVVLHIGNRVNAGHYVYVVCNTEGNPSYVIDDSRITKFNRDDFEANNYILIYKRAQQETEDGAEEGEGEAEEGEGEAEEGEGERARLEEEENQRVLELERKASEAEVAVEKARLEEEERQRALKKQEAEEEAEKVRLEEEEKQRVLELEKQASDAAEAVERAKAEEEEKQRILELERKAAESKEKAEKARLEEEERQRALKKQEAEEEAERAKSEEVQRQHVLELERIATEAEAKVEAAKVEQQLLENQSTQTQLTTASSVGLKFTEIKTDIQDIYQLIEDFQEVLDNMKHP